MGGRKKGGVAYRPARTRRCAIPYIISALPQTICGSAPLYASYIETASAYFGCAPPPLEIGGAFGIRLFGDRSGTAFGFDGGGAATSNGSACF